MIVPMKKTSIIVQAKDANASVERLRSLGVLHIQHSQLPKGEDVASLREEVGLISSAINILSEPGYLKLSSPRQKKPTDWKFVVKHIIELDKRLQQLEEYSRILLAKISEWKCWGDFDPEAIEGLKVNNLYIRFYQVPPKQIKDLPRSVIVKEIFRRAGLAHCVLISEGKIEIPFQEVALPKMGLEKMRTRLYEDDRMTDIIIDDICGYLIYRDELIEMKKNLEKRLEFREAVGGMGQSGAISYLTGYAPFDEIGKIEAAAGQGQWGLLVEEPSVGDAVPVLLRQPRWVALIKPVFNLLGILPGYGELDVSLIFLVFFSIFFGILIGDAGYGLVYLTLAFWFQKKKGSAVKNKNIFFLFYLLSSCAIVWGFLSGCFFGQEWLINRNIKALLPPLNDPVIMQNICFFLGALHLTIAHAWRACVKFPNQTFLADLGWIAVLWLGYFLARALILAQAFPAFGLPLAFCAIALVLFFSEPRKNVFKRLGAGFLSVTFGLSFMSAFTDVVSYVRLFAVGLAGIAIANTTNTMAAALGSGIVAFLGGVLIRVIGHALNIVLGPIGVLVHGVRLNVLEFGVNHTNITWSGTAYKPLAENVS